MNYDDFRTLWHEAASAAGLLPYPARPAETIDLRRMNRRYSVTIPMHDMNRARPFYVTAGLSWQWDALHSARTATTEEDVLIELLGQDGCDLVTERPWLRVDITLYATLPVYAPLPLPDASAWRRWAGEVTRRLASLLPTESPDVEEEQSSLLSWRGDPGARLQCATDGQLWLTGVSLPAWQGIELSRQWDNPDREPDFETESQLADFCGRLSRALKEWAHCLRHLAEDSPK
jgi:hypothetical protein